MGLVLHNMADKQQGEGGGEREEGEENGRRGKPTQDSWKLSELQTYHCLLSHKVKTSQDVTQFQFCLKEEGGVIKEGNIRHFLKMQVLSMKDTKTIHISSLMNIETAVIIPPVQLVSSMRLFDMKFPLFLAMLTYKATKHGHNGNTKRKCCT